MRFIHVADMHFDTPFTVLSNKSDLGDIRRLEQREAFKKMIEYIKEENIPFLFIAGDLYEHQYIRQSTVEYINDLFKTIPDTKIFISPGNHDPFLKNSFYNNFSWNENVYIFNDVVKTYEFSEIDIYGFGFTDFYCTDLNIENIKIKNKEKLNILVIHGSLDASSTLEMQYNPVNSRKLSELGFSYVALGHIHKITENLSGNIIYPGSMISFGFDELGEHGMLDIEINKNKRGKVFGDSSELVTEVGQGECSCNNIQKKFIKLDNRIFEELKLNISEINSEEELIEKINKLELKENNLYKLILIGNKNFEINKNKINKLILNKNIIKVKDDSKLNIDIYKMSNENSLKGFFIKELINKLESGEISEDEMQKAIEIGLESL